eukprot:3295057-Prymnesium_polylepis.1
MALARKEEQLSAARDEVKHEQRRASNAEEAAQAARELLAKAPPAAPPSAPMVSAELVAGPTAVVETTLEDSGDGDGDGDGDGGGGGRKHTFRHMMLDGTDADLEDAFRRMRLKEEAEERCARGGEQE